LGKAYTYLRAMYVFLWGLLWATAVHADLKVIGAGHGRTGTTSLKAALEELGLGVAHHMQEVFMSFRHGFSHANDWIAVSEAAPMSKERIALLKKMFPPDSEFHSILDAPGYLYYRELHEIYPDAKIILTVRDNPDAWVKSVEDTIANFVLARQPWGFWPNPGLYLLFRLNPLFAKWSAVIGSFGLGPFLHDKDSAAKFYTNWNEQVKQYFKDQPDKLLVFNSKEGWGPLCKFLSLPVPNTPFPRVNDTASMGSFRLIFNVIGFLHLIVPLVLLRWAFRRYRNAKQKAS